MSNIIIEYLPTIIGVVSYVILEIAIVAKLKGFSFKKDTENLEAKVDKMIKDNKALHQENLELKKQLKCIIDNNMKVKDYMENKENE